MQVFTLLLALGCFVGLTTASGGPQCPENSKICVLESEGYQCIGGTLLNNHHCPSGTACAVLNNRFECQPKSTSKVPVDDQLEGLIADQLEVESKAAAGTVPYGGLNTVVSAPCEEGRVGCATVRWGYQCVKGDWKPRVYCALKANVHCDATDGKLSCQPDKLQKDAVKTVEVRDEVKLQQRDVEVAQAECEEGKVACAVEKWGYQCIHGKWQPRIYCPDDKTRCSDSENKLSCVLKGALRVRDALPAALPDIPTTFTTLTSTTFTAIPAPTSPSNLADLALPATTADDRVLCGWCIITQASQTRQMYAQRTCNTLAQDETYLACSNQWCGVCAVFRGENCDGATLGMQRMGERTMEVRGGRSHFCI